MLAGSEICGEHTVYAENIKDVKFNGLDEKFINKLDSFIELNLKTDKCRH